MMPAFCSVYRILSSCPTLSRQYNLYECGAIIENSSYPEISILLDETRRDRKFKRIRLLGLVLRLCIATIGLPCFVIAVLQKDKSRELFSTTVATNMRPTKRQVYTRVAEGMSYLRKVYTTY